MQAAILRVKLKHVDDWNQRRRIVACRYHGLLAAAGLVKAEAQTVNQQAPIALLASLPDAHHIYHQFVVRAWRRDELRNFLTERGIGSEIYYPVPLHSAGVFRLPGISGGRSARVGARRQEVLALPIFPELREDEQQRVVAAIAEFYSK